MEKKNIMLSLCLLFGASPLAAQNRYDFAQFWKETGLYMRQPAEWDGGDWLKLGVLGAATVELHQYDSAIRRNSQLHRKNYKSFIVRFGGEWGGFFVTPIAGVGLVVHGWTADNEATKRLGFDIIQSAAYAEAVSVILKVAVGRARPATDLGADFYRPFTFLKSSYNSFPAGHNVAAFSLSTVLARSTDSLLLKTIVYVPAGLAVASRIYRDEHWATDCLVGAALGYFTADWVMDLHEKNARAGGGASGWRLRPYQGSGTEGFAVGVPF